MIELSELSFGYRAGAHILHNVTHVFPATALTGISGPSGRGKSTLLYLIGLLLKPVGGSMCIGGQNTAHLSDAERSRFRGRNVGFVFQDAALDTARSIIDNVTEGAVYTGLRRAVATARARELLADVGVTVPIERRPGQISGGQAQRVALCRALLHEPLVVLADEPTGNLDAVSAGKALAYLRAAAVGGACVLVASHDRAVLDACDDVLVLT